jgi:hypothetical protein
VRNLRASDYPASKVVLAATGERPRAMVIPAGKKSHLHGHPSRDAAFTVAQQLLL